MSTWTTIPAPDASARAEAARRRALLPAGALGDLGPALDRIAAARGTAHGAADPMAPGRPTQVVFAADHGIAFAGVTAYPPGTTARRIADLASGVGPIAHLAFSAGVTVRTVDVAVRGDLDGSAVDRAHRVRTACGRIDMQDALRGDELDRCLQAGIAMADAEIDGGADLLIGSICSAAVSTPAAALVSALTGMEPALATTRGSGIGDTAWIKKCAAVRDARFRARGSLGDARALLTIAGGPDLAALTGFIAQAALRRTPVLVDDVPSLVCAVLAHRLAPGAEQYVTVADTTADRTQARLHQVLGLTPLSDHALTLGSGAGALLAVPAIRSGLAMLDRAAAEGRALPRTADAINAWNPALL
jgi:nicotinate-nucleotide--dimethylbenzimidazole phosphoribosyltransferase